MRAGATLRRGRACFLLFLFLLFLLFLFFLFLFFVLFVLFVLWVFLFLLFLLLVFFYESSTNPPRSRRGQLSFARVFSK